MLVTSLCKLNGQLAKNCKSAACAYEKHCVQIGVKMPIFPVSQMLVSLAE